MYKKSKKPDPITNPYDMGSDVAERIYHALKPADAVAREMEQKWGADRLTSLVSTETASKFGGAKAKLDQAIESKDPLAVRRKAEVMVRAWKALDQEAQANGAKAVSPEVWSATGADNKKYAFVQSNAEAWMVTPELNGVNVYSIDEVVRILDNEAMALLGKVKDTFPKAKVTQVTESELNDEVPF